MKITILFLALIALGFSVKAQRMALADNKTHGTTTASASTPIPAKTPQFVFTNYGIDLNHADLKEYPQHFLGDRIARKLYATQKVYVRRHTATVGFTDNTMEIYKPAIYNSVMKLDSYFKKAVRRRKSTNKQLRQNCRNAWMQPLSLTMRKKPESSKKP